MKTKLKLYFEIAGLFLDIIGILPEHAALVIWAKLIEESERGKMGGTNADWCDIPQAITQTKLEAVYLPNLGAPMGSCNAWCMGIHKKRPGRQTDRFCSVGCRYPSGFAEPKTARRLELHNQRT